jgi:quinol monooxygenase YgiN
MERIQTTATFPSIAAEALSEFKKLAVELLDAAREEPGTTQYDWFFNSDETQCVVRESFANSDAVLAHMRSAGAQVGRLFELGGGLRLELFGSPSEELRSALVALDPPVYTFAQGK